MPTVPLPAQESPVHSCSHVPKHGLTPAVCLHWGRQQSRIFGITMLLAEKQPLLEWTPAGISQLTAMLSNCCVQGEDGSQIQTQQGKPSRNWLDACPSQDKITVTIFAPGDPQGWGCNRYPTPYTRAFPIQLQAGYSYD